MNKEKIYTFLEKNNIKYEKVNHKAVFTMEELQKIDLPYKENMMKKIYLSAMIKK